ncbi:MAG: hypothetical protein IKJ65_00510 [Clostridia bacterium]|nr:hypothetical protein [Clostridia bacterium]
MKSIFRILMSFLLILTFSLPSCLALEMTDKTYLGGKTYSLKEETINLSGVPVYAQSYALDKFGLPAGEQEGLVQIGVYEDFFSEDPLTLKFASDDLSTLMFDGMVCLRNGRLIVPSPSYTRGVEDTYGVFERITSLPLFYALSTKSGMTFSSDGRYALYIDGHAALTNMRYEYQLFILDVEAGEWYLGYTWPTKVRENPECVVGACFDETNEYIYINAFGQAYADRNSILRYSIKTGEMEHLVSSSAEWYTYNNLFRTPDGKYVHTSLPMNASGQPGALAIYEEVDGRWMYRMEYLTSNILRLQNLNVNSKTGQALLLSWLFQNTYATAATDDMDTFEMAPRQTQVLSLPIINNGVQNLNKLIWFDADMNSASLISISEYVYNEFELVKASPIEYLDRPILYNAALSPNGEYVFLVFSHIKRDGGFSARIMNTKTLEISPVSFEEGLIGVNCSYATPLSNSYPLGVNFITNDLIVINTQDGLKLFKIQLNLF